MLGFIQFLIENQLSEAGNPGCCLLFRSTRSALKWCWKTYFKIWRWGETSNEIPGGKRLGTTIWGNHSGFNSLRNSWSENAFLCGAGKKGSDKHHSPNFPKMVQRRLVRKCFYVKIEVTPHCFLQKLLKIGSKNTDTTGTTILLTYIYGKMFKYARKMFMSSNSISHYVKIKEATTAFKSPKKGRHGLEKQRPDVNSYYVHRDERTCWTHLNKTKIKYPKLGCLLIFKKYTLSKQELFKKHVLRLEQFYNFIRPTWGKKRKISSFSYFINIL